MKGHNDECPYFDEIVKVTVMGRILLRPITIY